LIDFWCFNATFNNISAIPWPPVLVVEEAEVHKCRCYVKNTDVINVVVISEKH
jgi:hypothetical protein